MTIDDTLEGYYPELDTGVPDWRKRWAEDNYKRLEPWQIAWGLLRHVASYQLDWLDDFHPRFASNGSTVLPPPIDKVKWGARFFLRYAVDPTIDAFTLDKNPFVLLSTKASEVYRGPLETTVRLLPHQAMIIVSLYRPLAPQLKALKHEYSSGYQSSKRLRLDKYSHYVCVRDAQATGASQTQIGCTLYPKLSREAARLKVKKDIDAARKLLWHECWHIAHQGK